MSQLAPFLVVGVAAYLADRLCTRLAARPSEREEIIFVQPPPMHHRDVANTDFYVRGNMGYSHSLPIYGGHPTHFYTHPVTGGYIIQKGTRPMHGEGLA